MKKERILKTSLLAICLALFICGNAQITVKGMLVDSASAKPVPNAAVNFHEPEKKISRTVASDQSGAFQASLPPGKYQVMITHGSFRRMGIPLKLEQESDMGSIRLVPLVKSLAGVTITAVRPLIEQQADRVIYNVEEDPSAQAESASEILRKTPFVNVDGDGGIQVNGQSNFRVLLNGRETALFSQNVKEALKAFPGASISRIEVITSPSAKYDAEGVGGIINIITKKKFAGYNGTVTSGIHANGNRTAGLNFNMKTGKLGVSGMYTLLRNSSLPSRQLAITTPAQAIPFARRQVGGNREMEMFFQQANLELSYDLDSNNTLVVYGNLGRHRNEMMNQYTIHTLYANGSTDTSPYLLETETAFPTHGFGTDFIRKFKGKPQKEFSVRFQGLFNAHRNFANSQQEIGGTDRFVLNSSEASNSEYTVQVDFIEPMNKSTRLEAGIKVILRNASSDFVSQFTFNKTDPYHIDPANSDRFTYDQDVYGGYASLNKITKLGTARLGLRVEHTRVHGDFTSTLTSVRQQYTNFIPNLLLTRQFSKTMAMNLTYSMRLGRPSISSLNPFVNNSDSLNISHGNPDLGPQYVHSFMWQNRFFKGSRFLSIQPGFNFANNLIIQNPSFDPATGVTRVTGANAGQIREFILVLSSNLPIGKWNMGVNASGRWARIRNSLQSSWAGYKAGNVNGNFSYKATPRITLSSNGGYFVPLRTPNATFPDNYFYSFSFACKLFRSKMTATAAVTNFFEKERTLKYLTENEYFITENMNHILFRNFSLSLNYSFGRLKGNVSKKKGITNDDEVQ